MNKLKLICGMSEGDSEFLFDDCWCGRFICKQAHSNPSALLREGE